MGDSVDIETLKPLSGEAVIATNDGRLYEKESLRNLNKFYFDPYLN